VAHDSSWTWPPQIAKIQSFLEPHQYQIKAESGADGKGVCLRVERSSVRLPPGLFALAVLKQDCKRQNPHHFSVWQQRWGFYLYCDHLEVVMCLGLPGHAPQRQTKRLAGWGGTKDVVSAITWARSCIKPTPSERDEISAEDENQYQIKIFSKDAFNDLIYKGKFNYWNFLNNFRIFYYAGPEAEKVVHLYHHHEHFDVITKLCHNQMS